jgi:YVTN family beta-propeller protein
MKLIATLIVSSLVFWLCATSPALAGSSAITVGTVPKFLAVNRTTNLIYVSNLISGTVSVIDGNTNAVMATVTVGLNPEGIDVNPTTNTVYVANLLSNSISVIDGGTNTVAATIVGVSAPLGVAVNSTTNQIFVSNSNAGSVSVIDGATNSIVATISVGSSPGGVAVNPSANLIYAASAGPGTISVIDGSSDTVTKTFTLPQGSEPTMLALDRISNRLFVVSPVSPAVYALSASSGVLLKTITGGNVPFKSPASVTIYQPGKTFLVSDNSSLSTVSEFSESTYLASTGLKGGNGPYGMAVNGTTGKTYVAESGDGTVIVYKTGGTGF